MLTTTNGIRQDWEIQLQNPDPPYQTYRYPYHLRAGAVDWDELLIKLSGLHADHILLVTEDRFPQALAEGVQHRLGSVAPCTLQIFPGRESAKGLKTIDQLSTEAIAAGATRRSVVVALGGGLAGNVGGLLAGLLYRGVRLVHVPTTLLAMSDSCLSLKQAVNSALGKNHVGLYHPPVFVWSHLAFLAQLPAREIRAALCELIKNVLAIAPQQYAEVLHRLRPDACYSEEELAWFIGFCLEAKCAVMGTDALEKHRSVVLEYGHTIGHALELLTGLPHGLAIGVGMVVEARMAFLLGLLSEEEVEQHLALLRANGAPTALPAEAPAEALLPLLARDNKRGYMDPQVSMIDLVLLEHLGQPHRTGATVLTQVDVSTVQEAIEWARRQADPAGPALEGTRARAVAREKGSL